MVLQNHNTKTQWLMKISPILLPLGRCLVFVATQKDCDVLSQSQMVQKSPSFSASGSCSPCRIVSIHGDEDDMAAAAVAVAMWRESQGPTVLP